MRLFRFVLCFSLVLFVLSCNSNQKPHPKAVKGVLELRGWDFEKDGIIGIIQYTERFKNQIGIRNELLGIKMEVRGEKNSLGLTKT